MKLRIGFHLEKLIKSASLFGNQRLLPELVL